MTPWLPSARPRRSLQRTIASPPPAAQLEQQACLVEAQQMSPAPRQTAACLRADLAQVQQISPTTMRSLMMRMMTPARVTTRMQGNMNNRCFLENCLRWALKNMPRGCASGAVSFQRGGATMATTVNSAIISTRRGDQKTKRSKRRGGGKRKKKQRCTMHGPVHSVRDAC